MALSERTKNLLLAPFAISPILQRFSLPALVGMALLSAGVWQSLFWLKVVGVVLAAPVIWAYAVLVFVYIPLLIFDGIRRRLNKRG